MDSYFNLDDYLFDDVTSEKVEEKISPAYSQCEVCGSTFSQDVYRDKKTKELKHTEYKRCPNCRKDITSINSGISEKTLTIKYTPYEWQKKFHASKATKKVISGAARSGKDRASTMEFTDKFIQMLNEDRDYTYVPKVHGWIIAPTYKLAGQLMREIFHTFPKELVVNYSKEEYSIETINGGLIEFRSADDPDSLVSVGLDIVWITEAARIKDLEIVIGNIEDRLSSPGRGLNKQGGFLLINSSPRGRTYFNTICKWGNIGSSTWRPGWETFYISRWDNPYFAEKRYQILPNGRTYEEDLKLSRSERQYNEDILGIPSDEEGTQFPNFRDYAVIEKEDIPEDLKEFKKNLRLPNPEHIYSIGYDPAKQVDGAWAVVYDETDGIIVEIEKYEHMNYREQIQIRVASLSRKWNYAIVRYGKTGVGEALEPFFIEAGIEYIAYPEQGRNKERLVENLGTLIKTNRFKIYNVDDLTEEMIRQFEDYGYSTTEKGNITYSNMTSGSHDDAVSASYFAVADAELHVQEVYNEFSNNSINLIKNKNINPEISKKYFGNSFC